MWWEILPGAAVMFTALWLPGICRPFLQRWGNSGKERRTIASPLEFSLNMRDVRLSDNGHYSDSKVGFAASSPSSIHTSICIVPPVQHSVDRIPPPG
uniref:Uncharacterized protein n=1 Tax=Eptatretus burgeri TaxID=7764 RepID=A0A8C4X085_EPTBU